MTRIALASILSIVVLSAFAQNPEQYASLISSDNLVNDLKIIASDSLGGRFSGSKGQHEAAAFIANNFRNMGLMPIKGESYYQRYKVHFYKHERIELMTAKKTFNTKNDIVLYGATSTNGAEPCEVIYAGYGTDSEIEKVDIRNRIVFLIVPNASIHEVIGRLRKLVTKDVIGFMLYSPNPKMMDDAREITYEKVSLEDPSDELPVYIVSKPVVESLFGHFNKLKVGTKPVRAAFIVKKNQSMRQTENVIGYLEGTDKKEEVLVITAHHDHLGFDYSGTTNDIIFNGADDNGSGTAGLLELARIFSIAKKNGDGPRRSILFVSTSEEELGVWGSEYYVENPTVALTKIVADVNMDMIGRSDSTHKDKSAYVYMIGIDTLSKELQEINTKNNNRYTKLDLDYTYSNPNHPEQVYRRSDHVRFAHHGIPIIFYFDGFHEDYHKVTDSYEKIDLDLMKKRLELVFYTTWEIANGESRLNAR